VDTGMIVITCHLPPGVAMILNPALLFPQVLSHELKNLHIHTLISLQGNPVTQIILSQVAMIRKL
jgi:hypothetical protein